MIMVSSITAVRLNRAHDLHYVVHFANSAHLLDMLTQSQVRGFRFRMFTDRFVYLFSAFLSTTDLCVGWIVTIALANVARIVSCTSG